jgi:hypothetical protein
LSAFTLPYNNNTVNLFIFAARERVLEMRPSSKLVIILGAAAAVMLIAAGATLAFWGKSPELLAENTPGGVVQRFLLALQDKDQARAATYVLPSSGLLPDTTHGNPQIPGLPFPFYMQDAWKATLRSTTIHGNNATVNVIFQISTSANLFGDSFYYNYVNFELVREGNTWLISAQGFSFN